MNWFGFNLLANAWWFFLIPPLVAFYFLKLKRPRLEIPSLVLWRQVLNDNRVNSPFQRFKRNILLFLQLLLLILVILAAMQPFWRGNAERAQYLPVLIDVSASMAATDKTSGRSRLARAKARVEQMIEGIGGDEQMCLVTFDRTARRVAAFTSNKRVLLDALDDVHVTDVGSDIEDALRMAQALSLSAPFERVVMLSDGNFPERTDFELSFTLDYQPLDPAGANVGITSLNAKRNAAGQWDVLVNVETSSAQSVNASVVVLIDGEQAFDTETLNITREDGERLIYQNIAADKPTVLEVRLEPDDFDALEADNVAYLDLNPTRSLSVYAPATMTSYRVVLDGIDGLNVAPADGKSETASNQFDLVISNDEKDLGLEAKVYLFVGVVPQKVSDVVSVESEGTTVVDWRHTAPLLEHVELTEVLILNDPVWTDETRDEALEALGYEALAYGRRGPLILRKRDQAKTFYYLLFDTDQSTLPFRLGFPIMMSNLVRVAMHEAGLSELRGLRTGVLPMVTALPEQGYEVVMPYGAKRQVEADTKGRLAGIPAPRIGRYKIKDGSQTIADLGVSLLDPRETGLDRVNQIQLNEHTVDAATRKLKVDHSFWPKLALIALIVLMVEWWFFQKRPGGWVR